MSQFLRIFLPTLLNQIGKGCRLDLYCFAGLFWFTVDYLNTVIAQTSVTIIQK